MVGILRFPHAGILEYPVVKQSLSYDIAVQVQSLLIRWSYGPPTAMCTLVVGRKNESGVRAKPATIRGLTFSRRGRRLHMPMDAQCMLFFFISFLGKRSM